MKKRLFAIIIVMSLSAAVLTACGGNANNSSIQTGSGSMNPASVQTYDTGTFTVQVPDGWYAIEQVDFLAEKDAKGNYPVDPSAIMLAKGTSDEWEAVLGPNVRISYYGTDDILISSRMFYDDAKDLDVTINGQKCDAFEGSMRGYQYQFVTLKVGETSFEAQILIENPEGEKTGINIDDKDVRTILESLKAK